MSETLEPCPFCGAVPETLSDHRRTWALVEHVDGCLFPTFPKHEIPERDFAAWNTRVAVTDEQFARAVHDGSWWGRCSDCEERRGYHEDAETIRGQQEHIAELQSENADALAMLTNQAATVKEQMVALRERDALIRDMWSTLSAMYRIRTGVDAGKERVYEERLRELGIEVEDEG